MKNYKTKSTDNPKKDLSLNPPSVTKYMTSASKLITFTPDTEINKAIDSLLDNRISGAPVLNDRQEVVGLIDDKDCLNVLIGSAYYNHPVSKDTVSSYMSNVMKSISERDNIVDVANMFLKSPYKRLLVMNDDGKLLGQISRRDILRAIHDMNTNTW